MDLAKLQEMGAADLKIDDLHLDTSASQIPYKISKWLQILNEEKLQYELLDGEYQRTYRDRYSYYLLKFNVKLTNKEVVDIYLPADEELQKIRQRRKYSEEKLRYIEGVVKSLNNMSFNISNVIKWREFQHGR